LSAFKTAVKPLRSHQPNESGMFVITTSRTAEFGYYRNKSMMAPSAGFEHASQP